MVAIDTVYTSATNPGAGPAAAVAASGDSLSVRDFNRDSHSAWLDHMIRRGVTAGFARLRSPRFHDNATGINQFSAETVDSMPFPAELGQPLAPNDLLIAELSGGAAETDALVMVNYYQHLEGADGRFATWDMIQNNVKNMKSFQVAAPAGANAWTDTPITTTENQLHADADYAVLGYRCSATVAAVAVKGADTGNLRAGGPGSTGAITTEDWFVRNSKRTGMPYIPVLNSNNRFSILVSAIDVAAVAGLIVTLVCAELATRFQQPAT